MVKKQKLNYVDFIPGINIQWKITKDNLVEIIVENKGFYNVVARRLLKKPRFSYEEYIIVRQNDILAVVE